MNYRHAYHAGNFADCMKHALLVWLLRALARKDKPFCVIDTHAGVGHYDLDGDAARRTGEADFGVRRLLGIETDGGLGPQAPSRESVLRTTGSRGRAPGLRLLEDYLGIVVRCGLYPGSPAIARALLRPGDRLVCCELHPEDHATLRRRFAGDPQVGVHLRDGFAAIAAFTPPAERRGLVLIDPPYEDPAEFERVVHGLVTAHGRFAGGVLAAWYPIKHRAPVRAFHAALRATGLRDVVAAEFLLREPLDAARLNGSGLVVVNPPFRFEAEAPPLLTELLAALGSGEAGAGARVERLADE